MDASLGSKRLAAALEKTDFGVGVAQSSKSSCDVRRGVRLPRADLLVDDAPAETVAMAGLRKTRGRELDPRPCP